MSSPEALMRHCPHFQTAIELVGRRWNGVILLALARGATRYGELRDAVPGLSERLLAQRLRELESSGVVAREVRPTTPVQIRYSLTESGAALVEAMRPLMAWADRWVGQSAM
ncbi:MULTISPECIES: winged helix-turn-helix transcriptional regulator [unclassified Nonomuraea]|uniref:winged helix-turn-helix transcriptional regulator n=1 Tax=Nonomuraea sp. NPDC003804 TaxID=3154547 RepID=UPI0033BBE7FC